MNGWDLAKSFARASDFSDVTFSTSGLVRKPNNLPPSFTIGRHLWAVFLRMALASVSFVLSDMYEKSLFITSQTFISGPPQLSECFASYFERCFLEALYDYFEIIVFDNAYLKVADPQY
jgi:hypothetical protein